MIKNIRRAMAALVAAAALGACGDDTSIDTDTGPNATATTVAATATTTLATTTSDVRGHDPRDRSRYKTFTELEADPGGAPVTRSGRLVGLERDAYIIDVQGGAGERIYAKVTAPKDGSGVHLELYSPSDKKLEDDAPQFDIHADESGKYMVTVRTSTQRPEGPYTVEIGVSVPAG